MADYLDLSEFSSEGLNIGKDAKVMAYLHGLSDFWVYIFDDASKVNMLMEANAVVASDIYNKFLQLTSGISLQDISVLTNVQIKLLLLSDTDTTGQSNPTSGKVSGKVETYYIPSDNPIKYAKKFVNRAFLPTSSLDIDSDFVIDGATSQVSFAKPIANCGFPYRVLADGSKQYAIWAIDAKMDDNLIYNSYAKLLGINPTVSTDLFKDFVYGLYYLFVNGPDLSIITKGLNLTLGIPLAREDETVLEIKKYLATDQFLVITDKNSYIVPFGLSPSVVVGQTLTTGDEISAWVEVKDYENDGDWWINFMIPGRLMPDVPPSVPGGSGITAEAVPNRYATAGSYADWLMRNYLKKHTFLVNVKTLTFKNVQNFEQLSDVIKQVKPSYTTPIYVWTVPVEDDILQVIEEFKVEIQRPLREVLTEGMYRFTRDSTDPLPRNLPLFMRMCAPASLDDTMGRSALINGEPRSLNGGHVVGYISPSAPYASLTAKQMAWNRAIKSRHSYQYTQRRDMIEFKRNTGLGTGDGERSSNLFKVLYPSIRMIYLYTTTERDITEKFATLSQVPPPGYSFTLFAPSTLSDEINVHAINDAAITDSLAFMVANFDFFFNKGVNGRYLGQFFPDINEQTYSPTATDLKVGDYMIFTRIGDGKIGAFWATTNYKIEPPPYFAHKVTDVLEMTISGKGYRGMAPHGSPYYTLRSGGVVGYNIIGGIKVYTPEPTVGDPSTFHTSYRDSLNSEFINDRTSPGHALITKKVWN